MRNVRNFFVSASIDGRDTNLTGGPVGKDGGFDLTIGQRVDGSAVEVLDVLGRASLDGSGELVLRVRPLRGARGAAVTVEVCEDGEIVIRSKR